MLITSFKRYLESGLMQLWSHDINTRLNEFISNEKTIAEKYQSIRMNEWIGSIYVYFIFISLSLISIILEFTITNYQLILNYFRDVKQNLISVINCIFERIAQKFLQFLPQNSGDVCR